MQIRPLSLSDIPQVATLIQTLAREFIVHESAPQARADFLAENDATAIEALIDGGMDYHVAEVDGAMAGCIGMRERRHVYHLFVDKRFQRQGLARTLWRTALAAAGHPAIVTVNSSNYAVPLYEALGFVRTAPMQCRNGLFYNPMQREKECA